MRIQIPMWVVAVIAFGAAVIFVPFIPWVVLAIWLGRYARKFHVPLSKRLGGRTGLSATLTVSLLLLIVLPVAAVVTSIVLDAITLVQQLLATDQVRGVLEGLVQGKAQPGTQAGGQAGQGVKGPSDLMANAEGAMDLVMSQGGRAWAIATKLAGAAAHLVIGLLIMVTGMYGVLIEGKSWWKWAEDHGPISPTHLARFGDAFIETGRGLWWGIAGAGMIQATVATIAYVAIGVPSALALGMLTLLFSVVPAIGTALVWVPVAAGLALTGRTTEAIVMGSIGVFVIGAVDNLARPWLARRGKLELPTWVVLISMFGGIELIGGWGVLLGPLVVRLAKEALIIARETRALPTVQHTATPGEPVESEDAP